MQYIVKDQISVSPLNENYQQCDTEHAKYQLEIYGVKSNVNPKVAVVRNFNNNRFSHPINSKVCVSAPCYTNGILLEQIQR